LAVGDKPEAGLAVQGVSRGELARNAGIAGDQLVTVDTAEGAVGDGQQTSLALAAGAPDIVTRLTFRASDSGRGVDGAVRAEGDSRVAGGADLVDLIQEESIFTLCADCSSFVAGSAVGGLTGDHPDLPARSQPQQHTHQQCQTDLAHIITTKNSV
jgi:hypothetical protein